MSDSRSSVLTRIRAANKTPSTLAQAEAEWNSLERSYRRVGRRDAIERADLLVERLRHYDAEVYACSELNLRTTLELIFKKLGSSRIAIPACDPNWSLPSGFHFLQDLELSLPELDQVDAVLTGCTLAIAETGTLVLQSGTNQGRRALTLVPDVYVCIVALSSIVETVPEAFARLRQTADLPTTFVSGPSATADIEMTRIKGVHGPRFLHVVLLGKDGDAVPSVK